MAAGDRAKKNDSPIRMFPACFEKDGMLSFREDNSEHGLESDSWRRSRTQSKPQIFRNIENFTLIVNPEHQKAAFENVTRGDGSDESGIRFDIHRYDDTVPRGHPVALSTSKGNKTYCLCAEKQANGEMRVVFKERKIPDNISGEASDIIFFQIPFSEGDDQFFKFESTLERGYFLAFETGEGRNSQRLTIKRVPAKDEVDETTKLSCSAYEHFIEHSN